MAETGLKPDGLLVVDKPMGWSSMAVVRKVRHALGGRVKGPKKLKVGHAGTLDPLATGILLVCVGKATRKVDRLMGQRKVYETCIDLSAFTASDDAEMPREEVVVDQPPSVDEVDAALLKLTGVIEQVPPDYSAIQVNGERAYRAARRGDTLPLKARPVHVERIDRLSYEWPTLSLRITCGKGTYIRSIARDLGLLLSTGGHLTSLRRTAIGEYRVEQAFAMERLKDGLTQADLLALPTD